MLEGISRSNKKNITRAHTICILLLILFLLTSATIFSGCVKGKRTQSSTSNSENKNPQRSTEDYKPWRFIVCGDPQNNYEVFSKVVEAAKSVDFLIVAGDVTGSGTEQELATFSSFMANSWVKFYAVPGNHDVSKAPPESLFAKYVGKPSQSFSHKNCFFVLIDNSSPEKGFSREERKRVDEDLLSARKNNFDHYIAVCHVPPGYPYSLLSGEDERSAISNNDYIVPVLTRNGVKELFCGHFHAFRQYEENNLRVTITGGAGAPLHASERNGGYHHYILVEVVGKTLKMKCVRI